jgi:hypothetical protein
MGLILLVAVSGYAQDQTGMIYGNVTTEDGAIIAGASVTAESPALIRPYETVTNARGRYVLPILPIGQYRITVKAENYQATALDGIDVRINSRLRIDIQLKTGVVGEEVVVITGDAPLVDVAKTDTGMNISKELFDKLPKGRDFTSIVGLAPGAADESNQFGGIMIDGASSSENVFVLDGASTNNIVNGRGAANAVFEFVEEVQVRSGGYSAEYGGSMGGVVNVVTRSGGNEFSGSLIGYYNADFLNGDPNPTLRLDPYADGNIAEYFENEKDDYNRFDVGGSLGGYVLKDRIWFFGSYMPWFATTERTINFRDSNGNVTDSETYEYKNSRQYAAGKVTVQLTDRWNASFSGSTDQYTRDDFLYSRQGTSRPPSNHEDIEYKFPGYTLAGRTDYFLTDDIYFSATVGYHYNDTERSGFGERPTVPRLRFADTGNEFLRGQIPDEYIHGPYYSNISFDDTFNFDHDERQQMSTTFTGSYFVELGGDHQWKAGFQSFWIKHDIADGTDTQYYFFYWRSPEQIAAQDHLYSNQIDGTNNLTGTYGYYRVLSADKWYGSIAEASSYRYAMFLQDSWSPTDKLVINAGVRAESERLPVYNYPDLDVFDWGFGDKLAPRVGVSYDFLGDGSLKLFGNFGVYYDVIKLEMAQGSFGGFNWTDSHHGIENPEWWTYPNVLDPTLAQYPGAPLGTQPINHRIPSFDTLDADTDPMYIFEYIAGLEWQFASNQAINVRFVHKTLRKAIEDVGVLTGQGEVYWIGNPGYGAIADEFQNNLGVPSVKAVRDYYGLDIRYMKSFSNNWTGGINLTFSRLRGNYSGLTSTDEDDRASPNVNRYFDLWYQTMDINFNENIGPLASDRRFATTIFGSYVFDEGMLDGLIIGVNQVINDGSPKTTEIQLNNMQGYYPFGRADLGRHDIYTQTDLYVEYNIRLTDRFTLNLNANIDNVWDYRGEISRYRFKELSGVSYSASGMVDLWRTGGRVPIEDLVNDTGGTDPRFGMVDRFQAGRQIRLGAKLTF